MQARKNQGLYYSEGESGDVTITWDGDTTGKDYFESGHLYKVSTDTPQAEQLKSFVLSATQSSESMTFNIDDADITSVDGLYAVAVTNPNLGAVILVCLAPEVEMGGYTFTQGIWLYNASSSYISQLVYGQTETIHHIEPKYIEQATEDGNMDVRKRLGLYYEEEGIVEKRVNFDELGEPETLLFSTYYSYAGGIIHHQCKFTDDVIALEDIISYGDIYDGQDSPRDISELRAITVLETENITIKCIATVIDNEGEEIVQTPVFYTVDGEFHSSGGDPLTINDPYYGEITIYDAEQGTYAEAERGTHGEGFYGWMIGFIVYEADGMVPHCIEPKYIKDIYYEETSEGEQTYIRGDNYEGGKISDNTPTQSDIISLDGIPASELYFNTITHGYTIAISANPQRDQEVVTVYTEDSEGASKGIYFPEVVIFGGTWAEELHWYGTNTTVHQIPEKYLPITKTLDSESTDDQIPSAKTVYEAIPDVSGKENTSNKVTVLSAQSTNTQYPSAKSVYDFVKPQSQSSIPAGGLQPGILYNLSVLTGSVTIDLATPADANVANEYAFTFYTGATAPTITWPNTILGWAGNCLDSNGVPDIKVSKFYEVSILNGIAAIMEVEV